MNAKFIHINSLWIQLYLQSIIIAKATEMLSTELRANPRLFETQLNAISSKLN